MLNRGDIIELNGIDEYVVGDIFSDLSKVFVYLIDNEEPTNVKFGIMDENNIIEITDPEVIEYLVNKMNINLHEKSFLDSI